VTFVNGSGRLDAARRDVVVVGGSAGGIAALQRLVARLPANLPASLLVVMHLAPTVPSRLAELLDKAGPLPARPAVAGEPLRPGRIYTAVTDRHLLVSDGDTVQLSLGPRENRVRPAVDALFRSAARWCGPRAIGVVLSGALDDGAAGLAAIDQRGGLPLVQRPDDARFVGMPTAALRAVPGATSATAADLGRLISEAAGTPAQNTAPGADEGLIWETDVTEHGRSGLPHPGRPAGLACPECGGGLFTVRTGNALHYVCHTGHSYSPQSLLAARDEDLESALWTAVSALQEKVTVLRELSRLAEAAGGEGDESGHRTAAEHAERAAEVLQQQLMSSDGLRQGG
jgi:two-component system chemotaxis response regulator CheB